MTRRRFLTVAGAGGSSLALSGCDAFDSLADRGSALRGFMKGANTLTYRAQRALLGNATLAQEFTEADIRQPMRPNGSTSPGDTAYRAMAESGFADFRLKVTGLVDNALEIGLDELKSMPARTQITRHDCVEGWSCIAKWTGVPLTEVLDRAGVGDTARFVVFRCFDSLGSSLSGGNEYYESIDMIDARHPQTILAYGMNGEDIPVSNGAPLRVRVERQLGYKMAKYIHTIELTDDLSSYGSGNGGYWEDRGYEWYAGI